MTDFESAKGVMLCERPSDAPKKPVGVIPFRPTNVGRDPLGMRPPQRLLPPRQKDTNTANLRHRQWLKQYGASQKMEKTKAELEKDLKDLEQQELREASTILHRTILATAPPSVASTNAAPAAVEPPRTDAKPQSQAEEPPKPQPKQPEPDVDLADLDRMMDELVGGALAAAPPPPPLVPPSDPAPAPAAPAAPAPEQAAPQDAEAAPAAAPESPAAGPPPPPPQGAAAAASPAKPAALPPLPKGKQKPQWAMTEAEVEAKEEAEADELVRFAEQLDIDAYLSDADEEDLRRALEVLDKEDREAGLPSNEGADGKPIDDKRFRRNFVRAMNQVAMMRAQEAARRGPKPAGSVAGGSALGGGSIAAGTEASAARDAAARERRREIEEASEARTQGPKWDASTKAGDDAGKMDTAGRDEETEEFLRQNPELRSVHSKRSARAMLDQVAAAAD
ncbi:unnamed protein product [Pedinophyceae sp. YPF-701]|nr:unnamed protein product [Pedinophyceae sp. YPF-701]